MIRRDSWPNSFYGMERKSKIEAINIQLPSLHYESAYNVGDIVTSEKNKTLEITCCNFSKAKLLLRKKKFQENLLEKTDGQLDNIERMV